MYVAIYRAACMQVGIHGASGSSTLQVERLSRMRAQEHYVSNVQAFRELPRMQYGIVIPNRVEMVHQTTACTTRHALKGVPCVCITMQSEKPEIPRGW